jgi:probable HAF family extracellular repeat protein
MKYSTIKSLGRRFCSPLIMLISLLAGTSLLGAEVRYRVVNLQAGAPMEVIGSGAGSINQHGVVAGAYHLPGEIAGRPFVYSDDGGFVPLEHDGGFFGYARAINDHDQVAVFGYVPGTEGPTAWRYTPGIGLESLGTLGEEGDIGDVPNGINNLGQIVGRTDTMRDGQPWQDAFIYTDEMGMVNLGSLGPNRYATAWAINDAGQITGHSGGEVFLYTDKRGMVAIGQGAGFAINQFGIVAGETLDSEAAIFENGMTRRLGTLGGRTTAEGINDYNVVVGGTVPVRSGFIWTEAEGMVRLDTLIEPGWRVYDIWDINNNGQIVGAANNAAIRLDPIPPRLGIQASTAGLVVSWSPAWPGVVLESTANLSAPDWQPLDTGGTNVVNMPLSDTQRFFRLNLENLRGLCCPPEP